MTGQKNLLLKLSNKMHINVQRALL